MGKSSEELDKAFDILLPKGLKMSEVKVIDVMYTVPLPVADHIATLSVRVAELEEAIRKVENSVVWTSVAIGKDNEQPLICSGCGSFYKRDDMVNTHAVDCVMGQLFKVKDKS